MRNEGFLFRFIAALLAVSLAVCLPVNGYSQAARNFRAFDWAPNQSMAPFKAGQVKIPAGLGQIQESYQGYADQLVVYLQDAHANYSAQRSIASIIEYLTAEYGIDLVSTEAAEGDLDVSLFRTFPEREITREVLDHYLRSGEIGGPEYAATVAEKDFNFVGVDQQKLYLKNFSEFMAVLDAKEEGLRMIGKIDTSFKNLRNTVYSRRHIELDRIIEKYQSEALDLVGFVQELGRVASDLNMHSSELGEIGVLLESVDFINRRAGSENAAMSEAEIRKRFEQLDPDKLSEDIERLTLTLKLKMAGTETERNLIRLDRYIHLFSRGLELSLSRREVSEFSGLVEEMSGDRIVSFLRSALREHRLRADAMSEANFESIDGYARLVLRFYKTTSERDEQFTKLLTREMKKRDKNASLLVTGGFHREGVTSRLKKAGISYVVILPHVDEIIPHEKYLDIMRKHAGLLQLPARNTLGIPVRADSHYLPGRQTTEKIMNGILRRAGTGELVEKYADGGAFIVFEDPRVDQLKLLDRARFRELGVKQDRGDRLVQALELSTLSLAPDVMPLLEEAARENRAGARLAIVGSRNAGHGFGAAGDSKKENLPTPLEIQEVTANLSSADVLTREHATVALWGLLLYDISEDFIRKHLTASFSELIKNLLDESASAQQSSTNALAILFLRVSENFIREYLTSSFPKLAKVLWDWSPNVQDHSADALLILFNRASEDFIREHLAAIIPKLVARLSNPMPGDDINWKIAGVSPDGVLMSITIALSNAFSRLSEDLVRMYLKEASPLLHRNLLSSDTSLRLTSGRTLLLSSFEEDIKTVNHTFHLGLNPSHIVQTNRLFRSIAGTLSQDFTFGAEQYVKQWIYLKLSSGMSSKDVETILNENLLPGLKVFEALEESFPMTGIETVQNMDETNRKQTERAVLLSNYFMTVATAGGVGVEDGSIIDKDKAEIRILPAPYSLLTLMLDQYVSLGILPEEYSYCTSIEGELGKEALVLMLSSFFMDARPGILHPYLEEEGLMSFFGIHQSYVGATANPRPGPDKGKVQGTQTNIYDKSVFPKLIEDLAGYHPYRFDLKRKGLLARAAYAHLKKPSERTPAESRLAEAYHRFKDRLKSFYQSVNLSEQEQTLLSEWHKSKRTQFAELPEPVQKFHTALQNLLGGEGAEAIALSEKDAELLVGEAEANYFESGDDTPRALRFDLIRNASLKLYAAMMNPKRHGAYQDVIKEAFGELTAVYKELYPVSFLLLEIERPEDLLKELSRKKDVLLHNLFSDDLQASVESALLLRFLPGEDTKRALRAVLGIQPDTSLDTVNTANDPLKEISLSSLRFMEMVRDQSLESQFGFGAVDISGVAQGKRYWIDIGEEKPVELIIPKSFDPNKPLVVSGFEFDIDKTLTAGGVRPLEGENLDAFARILRENWPARKPPGVTVITGSAYRAEDGQNYISDRFVKPAMEAVGKAGKPESLARLVIRARSGQDRITFSEMGILNPTEQIDRSYPPNDIILIAQTLAANYLTLLIGEKRVEGHGRVSLEEARESLKMTDTYAEIKQIFEQAVHKIFPDSDVELQNFQSDIVIIQHEPLSRPDLRAVGEEVGKQLKGKLDAAGSKLFSGDEYVKFTRFSRRDVLRAERSAWNGAGAIFKFGDGLVDDFLFEEPGTFEGPYFSFFLGKQAEVNDKSYVLTAVTADGHDMVGHRQTARIVQNIINTAKAGRNGAELRYLAGGRLSLADIEARTGKTIHQLVYESNRASEIRKFSGFGANEDGKADDQLARVKEPSKKSSGFAAAAEKISRGQTTGEMEKRSDALEVLAHDLARSEGSAMVTENVSSLVKALNRKMERGAEFGFATDLKDFSTVLVSDPETLAAMLSLRKKNAALGKTFRQIQRAVLLGFKAWTPAQVKALRKIKSEHPELEFLEDITQAVKRLGYHEAVLPLIHPDFLTREVRDDLISVQNKIGYRFEFFLQNVISELAQNLVALYRISMAA